MSPRRTLEPRTFPRRSAQGGFTLVEVVVSMLLLGLITAMCIPAFLTGRKADGRAERRTAASGAIRRVAEELKGYVTADPSLANGPGTGVDGWNLPGDQSGRRALEAGEHPLNPALWADSLAPFSGRLSYTVSLRATPSGPQPDVTFLVSWEEP